jgi:hypothetical protein
MESINKLVNQGKKSTENSSVSVLSVSIVISSFVFSLYSVISFLSDDAPFLYQCPQVEAHGITEMKRIDKISQGEVDLVLRTFIKEYLYHRYPKNKDQVAESYDYIVRHSANNIRADFTDRQTEKNIETVKRDLASGKLISFYPENSLKIRISKSASDEFTVQIDGRYIKESGASDSERVDARLEMKIERRDPSLSESINGLYVTEYNLTYTPDAVNGRRELLN